MALIGANVNFREHLKVSLLIAGAFMFINFLIPSFSLAVPLLPQASVADNYAIAGVVAPIAEEVGFRVVALTFFASILPSFFLAAVASALLFSGAHYFAFTQGLYTTVNDNIVSFIMSFVIGLILAYVVKKWSVFPAIIIHAALNLLVLSKFLLVISGV